MGNCLSFLTGARRDDYEEEDERLLFDDPGAMAGYGSFREQQQGVPPDDGEAQREMESLQRVVAKTADNMVDIFEIAPLQDSEAEAAMSAAVTAPPLTYAGQGARLARYHNLAARLTAGDDVNAAADLAATGEADVPVTVGWTETDDEYDYESDYQSGSDLYALKIPDRPLVGTFADAAAAMGRDG